MEVLLFALFFISVLIFFVAGKNDFGRIESKLIIKEENIKEEGKITEELNKDDIVAEKNEAIEELNKDDKVVQEGGIKPKEEIKKES